MPLTESPIAIYSPFSTVMVPVPSLPPHQSYQELVRWRYFSRADQRSFPWPNSLRRTPGLSSKYGTICLMSTTTAQKAGITSPWNTNRTIRSPRLNCSLRRRRTVFVTSVADFSIIEEAIRLKEKTTGACLNPHKSKVIAIGRWSALDTVLGILTTLM